MSNFTMEFPDGTGDLISIAESHGWKDTYPDGDEWTPEVSDVMEAEILDFLRDKGVEILTDCYFGDQLNDDQIAALLCVCQEYSHYWCSLMEPVNLRQFKAFLKCDSVPLKKEWGGYASYCLYECTNVVEHALRFHTYEDGAEILNAEKIRKGIVVMQSDYPKQFELIKTQDDDAETADIFLQLCLFGEVVYG